MRALLYDATLCIGCRSCMAACREKNALPETDATDLSDKQFTVIKTAAGKNGDVNYRRLCMHCVDPTCASVCPVGALHKTAAGPVVYNSAICLGCRYCVQACPFSVPRYEWTSKIPRVRKCDFCADRLARGQQNACSEACPTGASLAGERTALLKEAHRRLAANPEKYVPKIYGEHDAGGTSVLMLSPIPFAQMGLPENLPSDPLPMLTFRVLSKIPPFVAVGGCFLTGLFWLTNRKEEVARAEGRRPPRNGSTAKPEPGEGGQQ